MEDLKINNYTEFSIDDEGYLSITQYDEDEIILDPDEIKKLIEFLKRNTEWKQEL